MIKKDAVKAKTSHLLLASGKLTLMTLLVLRTYSIWGYFSHFRKPPLEDGYCFRPGGIHWMNATV